VSRASRKIACNNAPLVGRFSHTITTPDHLTADSDEAGHAFQNEAGHLFRSEAGRGSDLKPATQRMRPRIEAMMFRRGGLVKRAWVLGRRERRSLGGL
jgi:hypothetical protein